MPDTALARNAAELMTLAATLQQAGIQLELLTGPLTGLYDPTGMGAMLFAILAVAAQLDRDYIREVMFSNRITPPQTPGREHGTRIMTGSFLCGHRNPGLDLPPRWITHHRPRHCLKKRDTKAYG